MGPSFDRGKIVELAARGKGSTLRLKYAFYGVLHVVCTIGDTRPFLEINQCGR